MATAKRRPTAPQKARSAGAPPAKAPGGSRSTPARTPAAAKRQGAGPATKPGKKAGAGGGGGGGKARTTAAQRRAEVERQALLARPPVTIGDLVGVVPGIGPTRIAARVAGGLAVVASVLLVLAQTTPYLVLDGATVRAPLNALTVLALVLLLVGLVAPGVLLALGRGGRAAMAALLPFALTSVGASVQVFFEASAASRPATIDYTGREFHFGRVYSTTEVEARVGHDLALAAYVLLVVVLVLVVLAWPGHGRDERVPLGAARLSASGFGLTAGLVGAVALCLAPASAAIRTTTAADGITEVPVSVLSPPGVFGLPIAALVGGLLVAAGVLVAGTSTAAMSTRAPAVGGLFGLTVYLAVAAVTDVRDVAQNTDLVLGARTYALAAAALLALVGAGYVARVRRRAEDVLGSAEESRLGVPADELV